MSVLAISAVALVAVALLVTVHVYIWRRLVRDTTRPGPIRRVGAVVVLLLGLSLPAAQGLTTAFGPRGTEWVSWPGYLWMGALLYLVLALLVLEIPRLLALRVIRRREGTAEPATARPVDAPVGDIAVTDGPAGAGAAPAGAPMPDTRTSAHAATTPVLVDEETAPPPAGVAGTPLGPGRRLVLARSVALLAVAGAGGTVGYGMSQALGGPRVTRVRVPVARLDPRLTGLRIALVGDIHLGPLLGRAHTRRVVETINRTGSDLVAIVGDLADGTAEELGGDAAPLRDLESRHGSFFVTGNHDYMSGAQGWIDELTGLGVRTLRNERVEIAVGGAAFDLAGVNDLAGDAHDDEPDFGKALGDRDPSRPVVLMAHQPVQVEQARKHGVDVQLSGHTHGGQMFPVQLMVKLDQPVVAGLHKVDDTMLYVTRGAGFWGPPVRIGAPPEVTVVELHPR